MQLLGLSRWSFSQNPFMRFWKNSRIGPSARKGKKVRTTSRSMLPTRTIEKVMLSVLRPISVERFRLIIDPARASRSPIGANRPINMTSAVEMLKNGVFPAAPRKSEPLFDAADVNS